MPEVELGRLVGRVLPAVRPERCDGTRVDDFLDFFLQTRFEHVLGALDVYPVHHLRFGQPDGIDGREMKHAVTPVERIHDGMKIGDVTVGQLDVEPIEITEVVGFSDEHLHLVLAVEEFSHDGGTDISRATCDKNLHGYLQLSKNRTCTEGLLYGTNLTRASREVNQKVGPCRQRQGRVLPISADRRHT